MTSLTGIKECANCGKKFVPRTTWQETCTKECYHLKKAKEAVKEAVKEAKRDHKNNP